MVRKLAGTKWECQAKTLRITTQALVTSIANYCAPVWMMSVHAKKVDVQINNALRIICGAVQATPLLWLHILSNIPPYHITRDLPIFNDISTAPTVSRLKSRSPFWRFYRNANSTADFKTRFRQWWDNTSVLNQQIIADPSDEISGTELIWVKLNRVRTGHGCCAFLLHKWNYVDSPNCEFGEFQTIQHIWQDCILHRFEGSLNDIHLAADKAIEWIANLTVDI